MNITVAAAALKRGKSEEDRVTVDRVYSKKKHLGDQRTLMLASSRSQEPIIIAVSHPSLTSFPTRLFIVRSESTPNGGSIARVCGCFWTAPGLE
jgi:hypothetical protein